jgi:serine/threonine-protein kinase
MGDVDGPPFPADLGLEPLGTLGRGGTGWVFRARDPILDREVAVKVSRPDGGEAARKAMLEEARVTAALQHPAVLPIHRVGAFQGLMCVVYALAPATTLAARFSMTRDGAEWSVISRLQVMAGVASACVRAHELGIVHGDLHPGNVCVGTGGEPYVLDWSTPGSDSPSGHPGYIAPEVLAGGEVSAASDVYAVGAILWELVSLRHLRPRLPDEELGAFVARWRDAPAPPRLDAPDAIADLVQAALAPESSARPSCAALHGVLDAILTGHADRDRRSAEASELLDRSREDLTRMREIQRSLVDERQALAVQRMKIPGHAPIFQKRPLWDAETRVRGLDEEADDAWLDAVEAAAFASTLAPSGEEAHALLAELWWERMMAAERTGDEALARQARRRVETHDRGRYGAILRAPAHVSLTASVEGARATIARFVERDRVLVPEVVEEPALPLARHALAPGSWLITVSAPGYEDVAYPVDLSRLSHHRGAVRLYSRAQIGTGFALIPGGPFRMGGDALARQPLDACTPSISDRFMMTTTVRTWLWKAFLDALPPETARLHVPGEAGLFGAFRPAWTLTEEGWTPPEGWSDELPIMSVSLRDAEAFADWLSAEQGRVLRLPTEEEWEKAARGVDGRAFPWGWHFDPTYAHMRRSQAGPPLPSPVGAYPVDCSVYGCFDMAGGMRELTGSWFDQGQMVIRGGTWGDDEDDCRCACRAGLQPAMRSSFVSFRLVSEQPVPG